MTGTHETYRAAASRMPRALALPPGWPKGEAQIRILTDLRITPLSNRVPLCSRAPTPLRCLPPVQLPAKPPGTRINSPGRPSLRYMLPIAGSDVHVEPNRVHTRPTPDSNFLQGAQKTPLLDVSGPARCALSIVKWVRRRCLGFRSGPPIADRPGIAECEVGGTSLTTRTALPDFRGPVCDALRAVNLYGISKLR